MYFTDICGQESFQTSLPQTLLDWSWWGATVLQLQPSLIYIPPPWPMLNAHSPWAVRPTQGHPPSDAYARIRRHAYTHTHGLLVQPRWNQKLWLSAQHCENKLVPWLMEGSESRQIILLWRWDARWRAACGSHTVTLPHTCLKTCGCNIKPFNAKLLCWPPAGHLCI